MKCIKMKATGEIYRVKDSEARKKVATGFYHFVPKSSWKAQEKKRREELLNETIKN